MRIGQNLFSKQSAHVTLLLKGDTNNTLFLKKTQQEVMSRIEPAGPGEILRSVQKDESYMNSLHQNISSLGLEIFGPQTWIKYKSLCEPATRFLYYAVTTLSDLQTLGEEYTGLIQVNHGKNKLPSKFMRLLMIFLQTFGPHFLKYWFKNLQETVKRNPLNFDKDSVRRISNLLPILEEWTEYVNKINISIFYFHGTFYHLAKRLTGVSYVKYNGEGSKPDTTRGGFRYNLEIFVAFDDL